jgi:phenylacetate-CoA ligase
MAVPSMEDWQWPPAYDATYLPPPDQQCWFPVRETMDFERREAAILERIRKVMEYAFTRSSFYKRKWTNAGIEPADIRSMDDFEQVPVVTKEELRQAQLEHPPFGDYLCIPENEILRIHGTSGTTGRPTAFAIGRQDWASIAESHGRVMWGMGIRPGDMVFVGAVFSLYMGSWAVLLGAERIGAKAFPFGAGAPGQTMRAVNWILQMQPSALYGTPSYALRIAEVAQESNVDPHDFGIRTLFFSGEPGASIPSMRRKLEETYGARVFDSGSMGEMTPWMNLGETTGHDGMLCWQDMVYTEVVDPATNRRQPYGGEGTPVYTHLERTSQPMIRLLSGDLTRWELGPTQCGRTYPYLPKGIYGRIDDQFTIRGENVYPSAIAEVVTGLAQYGGEHRIVISREEAMDTLVVQVEYSADIDGQESAIEKFRDQAKVALRTTLGVNTEVVPVPGNTLERADHKSSRVLDRRDLFREVTTAQ